MLKKLKRQIRKDKAQPWPYIIATGFMLLVIVNVDRGGARGDERTPRHAGNRTHERHRSRERARERVPEAPRKEGEAL